METHNKSKGRTCAVRVPSLERARKDVVHRSKQARSSKPPEQPRGNGGVAAVDRALSILGAFEAMDRCLSLAELAQRTGLYKSTILRLAQPLLRLHYLQHFEDGNYRIGPRPLMLGAVYQHSLRLGDMLLPLMYDLADQTGESVSFYSRYEDIRVCRYRVDSRHDVRDHVSEGEVLPLLHGSGGQVLLAFGGAEGEPHETTRRKFYYASFGERDPETAGISVPIFGTGQRLLGSLTLSGPRSRLNEAVVADARVPMLRVAAGATEALGGDAAPIEDAIAVILKSKLFAAPTLDFLRSAEHSNDYTETAA